MACFVELQGLAGVMWVGIKVCLRLSGRVGAGLQRWGSMVEVNGLAAILNEVFCQDQARLGWVSLLLPTHAPQLK